MKNVLYVFILAMICLTSCSKGDDPISEDPIIGVWNIVTINEAPVNECTKKTEILFLKDGNYILEGYNVNSENNCDKQELIRGNWENKGNDVYSIKNNGATLIQQINILFSNNNNTITTKEISMEDESEVIVLNRK
ncbi:hypothetical protein SAMN04487911_13240 [Arenibacter nanhaiticus]|uniref:Lipocalin-like domain-containing protein n=1 Tax=Arenibacter nanhaiticus TaxID=558155 RepID=A0A1M6LMJ2_9FLAO|nr:lipocalin family protein [Arenibacter nanhaiticus]SHJ72370.1 hypothetical protein SAMN04487911_13240 [Arenibacter nanhaiticus]